MLTLPTPAALEKLGTVEAFSVAFSATGSRFWQFMLRVSFGVLILSCGGQRGGAADSDVVINEIMYHPPLDREDLQYIELFNRGQAPVDLSKWSFTKGVSFVFPEKTRLAGQAYLVVCRDTGALAAHYGREIPAAGNFDGRLGHHGAKIELSDASGKVIDSVKYSDQPPWPMAPDGFSASLERICPFVSAQEPANWAGSVLPPMEKPAGTPGRRNDSFSTNLPPFISKVEFAPPPGQKVLVTAEVSDSTGVKAVILLWRLARTGGQTAETEVPMRRVAGDERQGTYQAAIESQPAGNLIRFRVRAMNTAGVARLNPGPNEPRPTYSYSTFVNSNTARVALAFLVNVSSPPTRSEQRFRGWNSPGSRDQPSPTRGNAALIYLPPKGAEVLTFDHVHFRPRHGGFKVHFLKDQRFKEMSGINVIFEFSPRWLLSEPMAYELYRLAGVPAPLTEHLRVWMDGRPLGYHLLIEQPNKAFLAHNKRDDTGSLYKATWMGQGLIGQHEKKTRIHAGYDDLEALYRGLTRTSAAAQWDFIQKNFNLEEWASYYAVNMCIQNWDGFFNNHYLYHDGAGGKWEIYPWDEDKTWGDYDGASPRYDWYEMPLTIGMDTADGPGRGRFFGGGGWWRPPGYFSGPLLANPPFRQFFLRRLGEICTNSFTEEKMLPLINLMEKHLEPEIPVRAQLTGEDPQEALRVFHSDIQSLRNQVKYRRQFILQQIPKDRAMR